MKTVAIIPARLKSKRFPNKLVHMFNGKQIIDHVIENTQQLNFVDDIVIGSDSHRFAKDLYIKYKQLDSYHISNDALCGSHRAYKYYRENPEYDFYVSIPADEPAIDPNEVNKAIINLRCDKNEIVTFYTKFYCEEDLHSPLSCKIVTCNKDYMIYNSRAVVPINKDGSYLHLEQYKKHVGIFIFPREVFEKHGDLWINTGDIESLEQNRFMQHHLRVKMIEIHHIGFGVDVPEQIEQLENRVNDNRNNKND